MQQYQYDGPVMRFDDCIQHRWKATTVAPTEAKAKSTASMVSLCFRSVVTTFRVMTERRT